VITSSSVPAYRIQQATFTVPGTKPGTTYQVIMDTTPHRLTGRAVSCTCPDATYRKRVCKHMRAAEQGAAGKPHVKLAVAPATRTAGFITAAHAKALADVAALYAD
jgi:hypothetical protein